ncbi:MAG TPA: hypothetical protein VFX28_18455 [Methylomirabilota bacterium]|nr:hypothetical protein [Methylomirabilota bacterium]
MEPDEARMGEVLRAQRLRVAVNGLGLPAVALPTGLAGGVPLGVQVIGPRYREDLVLDAMEAVESRAGSVLDRLWSTWPS